MGAEQSGGADAGGGPPPPEWRDDLALGGGSSDPKSMQQQVKALQERVRDLELAAQSEQAAAGTGTPLNREWLDVLDREPVVGMVQLTPQTCAVVDRLFAALDINGDGTIDQQDMPKSKQETDVRGRAVALFKPLSDFMVRGEMSPADLRRALASRACRRLAKPSGEEDTLAGWIGRIQLEANGWVQRTVLEVLGDPAAATVEVKPPEPVSVGIALDRRSAECTSLTAVALAFSNLGFPTTLDELFATARLPLWTVQYSRMSLAETFHVARSHAETQGLGCYVSMLHARPGATGLAEFRQKVQTVATQSFKCESVGVVLLEASTAIGSRGVEGEDIEATIHATLIDSLEGDEVVLLDTEPKRFGLRWSCNIERLHLACCALAAHDLGHPCGGIVSVSRAALDPAPEHGNGQDIEMLATAGGDPDCFSRPAPWLPKLPVLSSQVPCHGLVALCAGLSAAEQGTDGELPAPGWPQVDTLCHMLNLPVVRVLEVEQTLSELADLALRWVKMRSLPVDVTTMHCDDLLPNAASIASLLAGWAATPTETRPILMAQFDGAFMKTDEEDPTIRMAIVVAYDTERQVVTFGEASVRHHACSWKTPVAKLWDACAAVGSFGRTGGILSLSRTDGQSVKPHKRALGDDHHEPMLHAIELPQFAMPIAATGLTSVAFALEALLQAAAQNGHLGDAEDSVQIPGHLRRPVSVDDIITLTTPVVVASDETFSMAETYNASASYAQKRKLPVRVDAMFFDGMTSESAFKEMVLAAVHSTREVLVLHFGVGAARGISSNDGLGHAAIVAGYDEVADELLLADASPKVYRGEWHASLSTIYKACCEVAPPPISRPRGAIRYALLTRAEVQSKISQHATSSKGGGAVPLELADHAVSTHVMIKTLEVPNSVHWESVPQSRLPALKAVALSMAAAGQSLTVSELVRVCGIPARNAHTPQWTLPDLAAVARLYIANASLDMVVQEVRFTGSGNSFDQFRREMERHHLATGETLLMAFQPSVAHAAPDLQSQCDYALVSHVDITAALLELTDMSAKVNCERWTCKMNLMYDALSSNSPARSKGQKQSSLPPDCLGMLRICSSKDDVAERMILDRVDERQLSLLSLPGVSQQDVSHGALVLQAAFSSSLNCHYDVLESLFDVDDVVSQDVCLPELRDRALICAHRQPELHRFRVDMVFCENEQCEENDFCLEMQRHSEAVGLGGTEALVVQFESARLFGAVDAAKTLVPYDWALVVAATASDVTIALFDGAQHVVNTRKLYAACAAHHPMSKRAMGFFRVAMVTAAPVNAKRCSTIPVDGPIAWSLHGDRIIANPPPAEPAPKEPDPLSKFRNSAAGFPKREEREQMFQRRDTNGNGRLSLSEVDDAVDDLWPSYMHKGSIMYVFKACDADGNGLITRREFASMVRSLAYFAQLKTVWGDALTDDTRFDLNDFEKGIKALWATGNDTDNPIDAAAEFKKLATKVNFDDNDPTVPVHRFCSWMSRCHDHHDGDWASDRYIHTEEKMVKSAENYFTAVENTLGTAACVPVLATIIAPEFVKPLPCTSLVALGICCDVLNSVGDGSNDRTIRRPNIDVDSIYRSIEIGIAQVLGLKESKQASLREKLFYRRAPTARVQSNVSIGIEQSESIANRLFAETRMPFCAEVQYFQRSATSEKAFYDFLRESRGRQTGDNRELAIVFFNAQVTHGVNGLGGCTVGILADYNEEANTVLVADMVPKKYGRLWSCSARRLYHGCHNITGERTYGMLRIRCGDAAQQRVLPDKKPSEMNGERLRWRRAIICVRFGVRMMNLSAHSKSKHEALVHWQQLPELKQNLPCAGLVGVAYALSAAGFPTNVSSIVSHCRLPINVLLSSTLTLGQIGTIAQQYIAVRNLPVQLVVVFFDSASVTVEHFKESLATVAERNARDQLLLNFDAEVAWAKHGTMQRNGWGLLSRLDSESKEVEICDAMGASSEAGEMWNSPIERLFAALCERDGCTKRARGAIHFSGPKGDPADFDSVAGLGRSEAVPSVDVVKRWVDIWPPDCDSTYGAVQMGTRTQEGLPCHNLTSLSMALAALDGTPAVAEGDASIATAAAGSRHGPNQMMQRLGLPVLLALNGSMSLAETASFAAAYIQACGLPIQVEMIHFDMGAAPLDDFTREMERMHELRVAEEQQQQQQQGEDGAESPVSQTWHAR
jgi:hypothetical protein